MISFDSDLYTCFPNDELKNECKLCGEKILAEVGEDGFVKIIHEEQKKCNHTNISQNCISYLIHTLTDRPYPRPMSKCLKCFGDIVYMWTNINYARWLHTDLMCSNVLFSYQTEEFAKILIINHLVNGGRIIIKTKCYTCRKFHPQKMPRLSAIDKNPYLMIKYNMVNVDLGCIDNNHLIGIIQVTPTEYDTYEKCIKEGLFFYELYPEQVIRKLDHNSLKNRIFTNKRYVDCKK